MRKNARIYVAGPYTKPDPAINTRNAILVGSQLLDHGFVPYIPHLTHFWHLVSPRPYEEWLDYDNHWVLQCDAVLRLVGESSGADKEVNLATETGIPVYYDIESLLKEVK